MAERTPPLTLFSLPLLPLAVLADLHGVSVFNFLVHDLPLARVLGRPIALYADEDDLGTSLCDCNNDGSEASKTGLTRTRGSGQQQRCCRVNTNANAETTCVALEAQRTGNTGTILCIAPLEINDKTVAESELVSFDCVTCWGSLCRVSREPNFSLVLLF